MADRRDEMPPPGPTDFYPDIRGAGLEERIQDSLGRIAEALEGLLAEMRQVRAHLGAPAPGREGPPPPEWPPRVET